MTAEVTKNYGFINILQKTASFVRQYPSAFREILYKNFLLGTLAFIVAVLFCIVTAILGLPFFLKGSNFILLYMFSIPINIFASYASFKSLRVIAASVYKKYVYEDQDKVNSFDIFFLMYSLIFREIFSWDILVIFVLLLIVKFISVSFLTIFSVISLIYIGATRLFKVIKLQCLPFAYLLENIAEEKSLLDRVYQLPMGSILLMNFYELTISLFNVLPWSAVRLIADSLKISNLFQILLTFLSVLILHSFGDVASTTYYDIRSKHHFQKTTNITGSLLLMSALCVSLLIIYSIVFPNSQK